MRPRFKIVAKAHRDKAKSCAPKEKQLLLSYNGKAKDLRLGEIDKREIKYGVRKKPFEEEETISTYEPGTATTSTTDAVWPICYVVDYDSTSTATTQGVYY